MTRDQLRQVVEKYNPGAPYIHAPVREIERRFPDQFVAIIVTKEDAAGQAVEGVLLFHEAERSALSEKVYHFDEPLPLLIESTYLPKALLELQNGNRQL